MDNSASDSDEHDLPTPSSAYPTSNQYPFGFGHGGCQGEGIAHLGGRDLTMEAVSQPTVGLINPEGKMHG